MESDFWWCFTWTRSFPELLPELDHFRCLQLQYFRFRRPQPDHTATGGDPIRARTWIKSTTRKTMFRQTPWFCVSICLFRFEIGYFYYLCFENNFNCSLNWVIIICSKFDCSKNLLDTILLLLDTVRAIIFFLVNCSNPVNLWELTWFEQINF